MVFTGKLKNILDNKALKKNYILLVNINFPQSFVYTGRAVKEFTGKPDGDPEGKSVSIKGQTKG